MLCITLYICLFYIIDGAVNFLASGIIASRVG